MKRFSNFFYRRSTGKKSESVKAIKPKSGSARFFRGTHEDEHKKNQAPCFCSTTNLPKQEHSLHGPSFHRSVGDFNVVVYSAAADADSANHHSISIFDGYSAAKSD
jgi:hypothetical protein